MILTLRINPIACTGHGVCAEVAPELIEPDEWGYPILNAGPVPVRLEREARTAVAACPVLALKLQPAKLDGPGGTVPPATWHARKKAVTVDCLAATRSW
jgi:ferredoxin